jgi:hypothetical protein
MMGLSLGAFTVSGAFLSFAFASPPYYLLGFATALLLSSRAAPPDAGARPLPGAPLRQGLGHGGRIPPPRAPISRYPAPPPRMPPPRGTRA